MSLKVFHIVFIVASILLAFGFAAWSLADYFSGRQTLTLVCGVGSFVAGIVLIKIFPERPRRYRYGTW